MSKALGQFGGNALNILNNFKDRAMSQFCFRMFTLLSSALAVTAHDGDAKATSSTLAKLTAVDPSRYT